MKAMQIDKRWMSLAAVGAALLLFGSHGAFAQKPKDLASVVDDKGGISLPKDFRKNLTHLGSWFVPEGDASGFHDVYTQPSTVDAFRKTGVFPDGAVLVKELRAHKAGNYTTGSGVAHATDGLKQWFVMVKDSKGKFEKKSPLLGDGWGWALFKPDAPQKNVATDYKADCLGCHAPAQKTDWVYIEAYPTLR